MDASNTVRFIYEQIICRFGYPLEIVIDQGTHFVNKMITELLGIFMIIHQNNTPYYPKCNRHSESTNKVLCNIMTKIYEFDRTNWQDKPNEALWAYHTTLKDFMGHTPFKLVYGLEAVVPAEYTIPSLNIAISERLGDVESIFSRLVILEKLS